MSSRFSANLLFQTVSFCLLGMIFEVLFPGDGMGERDSEMEIKKSFWIFVEKIETGKPYTVERVEELLGVELELESESASTLFYKLKRIKQNLNAVNITAVDLRISKNKPDDQGFLSIDLSDSIIELQDVQNRYPDSSLFHARPGPPPQGVSPNNSNFVRVEQAWGRLSFGFLVKNPKILSGIIFNPMPK